MNSNSGLVVPPLVLSITTVLCIVVSTFLISLHLVDVLGRNFFTHILIDEGAQAQEPESIAPLCLANGQTKILIAGDE